MSFLVQVLDQGHEVIRQFSEGPGGDLVALARRMRDSSEVMRIVDPYTDTMFNAVQQVMVRKHLAEVLSQSDLPRSEAEMARRLLEAVEEAHQIGGYVMILGE